MVTPAVLYVFVTSHFKIITDLLQLLTGYGELMLAEFKYGLEPKETFSTFFDQAKSHRSA